MNAVIDEKLDSIAKLRRRYHVQTLELFGSATGKAFNPQDSDLDFLVVFQPCPPSDHYERYFGLVEALESLFGRPVDLVEAEAMRNPYFIRRVNESRTPVYAA